MPLFYLVMLENRTENFVYWKILNIQEFLIVFILAIATVLMQLSNSRGFQLETAWKSSVKN